jgi:hypothetical protein
MVHRLLDSDSLLNSLLGSANTNLNDGDDTVSDLPPVTVPASADSPQE